MRRNIRTLVLGLGAVSLTIEGCGGDALDIPDAKMPADAAVCDELAAAAAAQFNSSLQGTAWQACQVDSDCSLLWLHTCFAGCGTPVATSAASAVTAASTGACDQYHGAGCREPVPSCLATRPICDHGTCTHGVLLPGDAGSPDAFPTEDTSAIAEVPIADASIVSDLPDGPADGASDAPDNAATAGLCTCDTTIHTTQLMQRYVYLSLDCFCASPYGFLCRSFDQASTLCARSDVHGVSAASFDGCTEHSLQVTIGSVAKGRPTYAYLTFDGNSFTGANYEADLICNNLPLDEVNDMYLRAITYGYDNVDASTCGSGREWNACAVDGGTNLDATSP